jgi:prepilin-type N-terminal cleavage/methylation domain-containing protein
LIRLLARLSRRSKFLTTSGGGYTLLELIIVVAIIGILSVVMIPQYLRVKESAEATTRIAETISLASQCGVAQQTHITETVTQPFDGSQRVCNGQTTRRINSRQWAGNASGVKCLSATAGPSHRRVRVIVTVRGALTCQFI